MIFSRGGNNMLLNFRFSNFKSYSDLAEYSMIKGLQRKHKYNFIKKNGLDVLTFSAIFGANAGGKSNLVHAIDLSQSLVLSNLNRIKTYNQYNKNQVENREKVSQFEYDIEIDEEVYTYGFSVIFAKKEIVTEYLYDMTNEKDPKTVYERDEARDKFKLNYNYLNIDSETENRINIYKEDTEKSTLFLSHVNRNNRKGLQNNQGNKLVFQKIFHWFQDTLEVIHPTTAVKTSRLAYIDEEKLNQLGKFLSAFDTGISAVKFERTNEEALELPMQIRERIFEDLLTDPEEKGKRRGHLIKSPNSIYKLTAEDNEVIIEEIRFIHQSSAASFSMEEESDGTKRIIEIFSILFDKQKKVYIVDELDRSLHPNLTVRFVEEFLKKESEVQLIVTTHEEKLLDLNMLRRDQVWFVDKHDGNSELYTLDQYRERFDKDIEKEYLSGRYGSVPNIDFEVIHENGL